MSMVGQSNHGLSEEQAPYAPEPHLVHYTTTKMEAEKRVLAANAPPAFTTVALRFQGVWGPRDSYMVSLLTDRVIAVSDKNNMTDNLYVENAAHAMLCADRAMIDHPKTVGGEAFFITNGGGGIGYQDFLLLASKSAYR